MGFDHFINTARRNETIELLFCARCVRIGMVSISSVLRFKLVCMEQNKWNRAVRKLTEKYDSVIRKHEKGSLLARYNNNKKNHTKRRGFLVIKHLSVTKLS